MPVACKHLLTQVILNMCRFVESRAEQAAWTRDSEYLKTTHPYCGRAASEIFQSGTKYGTTA